MILTSIDITFASAFLMNIVTCKEQCKDWRLIDQYFLISAGITALIGAIAIYYNQEKEDREKFQDKKRIKRQQKHWQYITDKSPYCIAVVDMK